MRLRPDGEIPGMFLTGTFLRGFSVGACVGMAGETAAQVAAYLEQNSALPRERSASQQLSNLSPQARAHAGAESHLDIPHDPFLVDQDLHGDRFASVG